MSVGEDTRNKFAMTFNALLGDKGKSASNFADKDILLPTTRQLMAATSTRLAANKRPLTDKDRADKKKETELSDAQKAEFLKARMAEIKGEDKPWWKDALHVGGNVLEALDVPAAYVRSGVKELADTVETSRVGNWLYDVTGYDPAEDGREPSTGSWSDFTQQAKRHMGFGEIWHDARGDDENKWLDRGVGLAGDIATDPLTYIGAGVVTKATDKAVDGIKISRAIKGKDAAQSVGSRAANAAADLVPDVDNVFAKAASERAALYKYTRKHPTRVVSRGLKAGAIDETEAIRRIKATHPTDFIVTGATGRNVINDAVRDTIDKTVYEVQKRSQAGKLLNDPHVLTRTVAQSVTEQAKTVRLRPMNEAVDEFKRTLKNTGTIPTTRLNEMRTLPYFNVWHDEVKRVLRKYPSPTPEQVNRAYKMADRSVIEAVRPEIDSIFAVARSAMENSLEKIPTFRMFGKQVAELPSLGRAAHGASKAFTNSPVGESLQKLFSYTSNFPGYSSLIAQKAKALGVARYEVKRRDITKIAKQYTREEARELQYMLENGIPGVGKMNTGYNALRTLYDDLLAEEVSAGVRNLDKTAHVKNYAYTHIRKRRKTSKSIEEWNKARTAAAQHGSLHGYTSEDAIKAGFSVEKDAFKNLLYRNMRASRKLTQAYFHTDLVTHYGIKGAITPHEAAARNLVKISKTKNNDILLAMKTSLKEGEDIYIDRDIYKIFNNYSQLAKQADEVIRTLDYLTRKFKIMNTIYFPGYHVRNMIGDIFMGSMDGVKTRDYSTILGKWARKNHTSLDVGGRTVRMQQFLELYEKNLGSGAFLSGELDNGLLSGNSPAQMVRKVSEGREDFGRIVHFYRAMSDEYKSLISKGRPKDRAWDEALNSSIFRVNKFKFDYSALTPNELKYMRRGIPFYTYMRKAIPTLVESMMLNPKYIATINRLQQAGEERYNDTLLPDWMRELGYAKLTDTYGMAGTIMPTQTIKEMFENPVSKFNPAIQIPFEMNSGEDTFSHRPLQGEGLNALPEILANKWRGTGTIQDATGKRLPNWETVESDKTTTEKLANFLGFPIKRVAKQEEEQALAEMNFVIKGKIQELNDSVADLGYSVYYSERNNGISLRVRDETSGEMVFEADSLRELKEYLKSVRS